MRRVGAGAVKKADPVYAELEKEIAKLKEENKQLKAEIKKLKNKAGEDQPEKE